MPVPSKNLPHFGHGFSPNALFAFSRFLRFSARPRNVLRSLSSRTKETHFLHESCSSSVSATFSRAFLSSSCPSSFGSPAPLFRSKECASPFFHEKASSFTISKPANVLKRARIASCMSMISLRQAGADAYSMSFSPSMPIGRTCAAMPSPTISFQCARAKCS